MLEDIERYWWECAGGNNEEPVISGALLGGQLQVKFVDYPSTRITKGKERWRGRITQLTLRGWIE